MQENKDRRRECRWRRYDLGSAADDVGGAAAAGHGDHNDHDHGQGGQDEVPNGSYDGSSRHYHMGRGGAGGGASAGRCRVKLTAMVSRGTEKKVTCYISTTKVDKNKTLAVLRNCLLDTSLYFVTSTWRLRTVFGTPSIKDV